MSAKTSNSRRQGRIVSRTAALHRLTELRLRIMGLSRDIARFHDEERRGRFKTAELQGALLQAESELYALDSTFDEATSALLFESATEQRVAVA